MVARVNQKNRPAATTESVGRFIDAKSAAARIGIHDKTLSNWRVEQRTNQPPFYKLGTKIMYKIDEIDAWLESQRVQFV